MLTFIENGTGKAFTWSKAGDALMLEAHNAGERVRCVVSMEVFEDHYPDESPESPSEATLGVLKEKLKRAASRGLYSDPSDDYSGKDLVISSHLFDEL